MSLTEPCAELWGDARIIEADPGVTVVRGSLYLPLRLGDAWGLFDRDGRAIEETVDFRGPSRTAPERLLTTDLRADAIEAVAPAGTYIYGGYVNQHFGHFLVNTLPRFWNVTKIRTPNTPILCHGWGPPEDWFAVPFIARCFGLLGLTVRDFVSFDQPTRLPCVVIPGTSLEEQQCGHRAYGRLGREIGSRTYGAATVDTNDRPIYYSKARLTSAVGRIVNEVEIEQALAAEGVEIIYPETLSFDEQIRLMASRTSVLCAIGSYLHSSIFCPPRRITCLNVMSEINSNYSIIDALAGNRATYVYAPDMHLTDKVEGVITARYLPNAADVARELLAIMRSST